MNEKNPYEVRELTGEAKVEAIYNLDSYAFQPSPPFRDKENRMEIIRQREGVRYFAALENSQVVAGVAATQMTHNVRGTIFPAHGIWGVVTLPQARRKGLCRKAMAHMLSAQRESGHVFSCLYPFRESFYGRMGYVNFPLPKVVHFHPQGLAPLLKSGLHGEVENVLIGDGYKDYEAYLSRMLNHTHGMGLFDFGNAERAAQNRFWLAKAWIGSELAGLMLYDLGGEVVTHFKLWARRFYYENSAARYLLLSWIASHIDQVDQVKLTLPPDEYPETWYADLNIKTEPIFAVPMGRVLDLARLDGLPVGPGRFAAHVHDSLCPWNDGKWAFESVDGYLRVSPAQEAAFSLSIQAVSALVYGVGDPGDFSYRGWGDPPLDSQSTLRQMFPARVPYLHEMF